MQPVSRHRIDKQVPGATNTHTIELLLQTLFSTPSVQSGYKEDNWGDRVVSCQQQELCTGSCKDRICAREAEESTLLEAVARERVLKTQQAKKGLADAVVICKVWRLAIAL
jgi:hypothetical protein